MSGKDSSIETSLEEILEERGLTANFGFLSDDGDGRQTNDEFDIQTVLCPLSPTQTGSYHLSRQGSLVNSSVHRILAFDRSMEFTSMKTVDDIGFSLHDPLSSEDFIIAQERASEEAKPDAGGEVISCLKKGVNVESLEPPEQKRKSMQFTDLIEIINRDESSMSDYTWSSSSSYFECSNSFKSSHSLVGSRIKQAHRNDITNKKFWKSLSSRLTHHEKPDKIQRFDVEKELRHYVDNTGCSTRHWYYHRVFRLVLILQGLLMCPSYRSRLLYLLPVKSPILDDEAISYFFVSYLIRCLSERIGEAIAGFFIDAQCHEAVALIGICLAYVGLQYNVYPGYHSFNGDCIQHIFMGLASCCYFMSSTVILFDWPHIPMGFLVLLQFVLEISSMHGYEFIRHVSASWGLTEVAFTAITMQTTILSGIGFISGISLSLLQFERSKEMQGYRQKLNKYQQQLNSDEAGASSHKMFQTRIVNGHPLMGESSAVYSTTRTTFSSQYTKENPSILLQVQPTLPNTDVPFAHLTLGQEYKTAWKNVETQRHERELIKEQQENKILFKRAWNRLRRTITRTLSGGDSVFAAWYCVQSFTVSGHYLIMQLVNAMPEHDTISDDHATNYLGTLLAAGGLVLLAMHLAADSCSSGFPIILTLHTMLCPLLGLQFMYGSSSLVSMSICYILKVELLNLHRIVALMCFNGSADQFGVRSATFHLYPGIVADVSSAFLVKRFSSHRDAPSLNLAVSNISYINIICILYPVYIWFKHRRSPTILHPCALFSRNGKAKTSALLESDKGYTMDSYEHADEKMEDSEDSAAPHRKQRFSNFKDSHININNIIILGSSESEEASTSVRSTSEASL